MPLMHRVKRLFGPKSQAEAPKSQVKAPKPQVSNSNRSDQSSIAPANIRHENPASAAFQSLIKRSIAAWSSLTYAGDETQNESLGMCSRALNSCNSLDDVFRSSVLFWFFQSREKFLKQSHFLKWDANKLDDYILLPVGDGFVNKEDCFYVGHFWRTKDHPDPRGEDFRLVHGDMKGQSWKYVWIDWTCLPQSPRSKSQEAYVTTMVQRAPVLMRECAFEWRYADFRPRLWALVEVAQYMLASSQSGYTTTPDMKPFVNDVLAMRTDNVRDIIRDRGYTCSESQHYRILVGWLELLIIMTKLVPDVARKRSLMNTLEPLAGSVWAHCDTGIKVDKTRGIVSRYGSIYRFAPLWPVGESGLPELVAEPSRYEPRACVQEIVQIMRLPELNQAHSRLTATERLLGMDHPDTVADAGNLANVFMKAEQYIEAEELYRGVLTSLQKTLGPEQPMVLEARDKLAEAVIMLKKHEEAEELRHQVLKGLQRTLGPDHPQTLDAVNKVGAILHIQKKHGESAVMFRQYAEGMKRYNQ